MNLLNSFIEAHLPTAKKEDYFSKPIRIYSGDNKIFVIGLGNITGIITEQKKAEILKQLNGPQSEVFFFTLFYNIEAFQKNSDLFHGVAMFGSQQNQNIPFILTMNQN